MPIVTGIVDVVDPRPVTDGPSRDVAPLRHIWTGYDGTVFDLTDHGRAKVFKRRGARGFGPGPVTHWWSDAADLPGSDWTGEHDDRGDLFVPLTITGDDTADYLEARRSFARTLDPRQTGLYAVSTPDGGVRYAVCRYSEGFDPVIDLDPAASCIENLGITWARADPYWFGSTVTADYVADVAGATFFSPPGSGSVVTISASNVLSSGAVTNQGDLDAEPLWVIRGPVQSFAVGVAAGTLKMAPNLLAGQSITADLRAASNYAITDQDGADRYNDVTDVVFETIPVGENIPLVMSAVGTGAGFGIHLEFATRYRSAW